MNNIVKIILNYQILIFLLNDLYKEYYDLFLYEKHTKNSMLNLKDVFLHFVSLFLLVDSGFSIFFLEYFFSVKFCFKYYFLYLLFILIDMIYIKDNYYASIASFFSSSFSLLSSITILFFGASGNFSSFNPNSFSILLNISLTSSSAC